mgnify:CR=1 FL=1
MPNTDDPYSVDYDMNPRSCELEHPRLEVIRIHPLQKKLEERLTERALARAKQSVEELAEEIATAVELKNENKK